MENAIVLYESKEGMVQLDVTFKGETLWLTQEQMANLFGVKRQAITRHLKNIFRTGELQENLTCSILEHVAKNNKTYQTKFYNLDGVISVGYRVNSTQATHFRIWATRVLKDHLIKGYSVYEKSLLEKGFGELQESIQLLQKTLLNQKLITDVGVQVMELVRNYAKTWEVLRGYDEDQLLLPKKQRAGKVLTYEDAKQAIVDLKAYLKGSSLFGNEHSGGLSSILGSLEQTFDGKPLYPTVEEKAGHLLYFTIKNHPFSDGNKRIGCLLFLLYLKLQNMKSPFNDNGLTALGLLVAESNPSQKELMVKLIVNLLMNKEDLTWQE